MFGNVTALEGLRVTGKCRREALAFWRGVFGDLLNPPLPPGS